MDLVLNNLQRLICHKTQQTKPNQTKQNVHALKNVYSCHWYCFTNDNYIYWIKMQNKIYAHMHTCIHMLIYTTELNWFQVTFSI